MMIWLFFFSTFAAQAKYSETGFGPVPPPSGVETFERDGRRVPPNSQCAELLRGAEADLGRPLTREEIEADLDEILAETGEQLLAPPARRRSCFTENMRVLTPAGAIPIVRLKAGDVVFSYDAKTRHVVENRIARVHVSENEAFGSLSRHGIEVTADHPFYTPSGYREIGALGDGDAIGKRDGEGLSCVPRGPYLPARGRGKVMTLELEGEPRNFFVEDILVHNKPIIMIG